MLDWLVELVCALIPFPLIVSITANAPVCSITVLSEPSPTRFTYGGTFKLSLILYKPASNFSVIRFFKLSASLAPDHGRYNWSIALCSASV